MKVSVAGSIGMAVLLMITGAGPAHAEGLAASGTGTGSSTFKSSSLGKAAYKTGLPQLITMPFKVMEKAGELQESKSTGGRNYLSSEDVVVGEPFNQSAETTG